MNVMPAFCLLFCSVLLLGGELPDPEDRVFSEQGQKIDSFLIRTANRISEAWIFCREEFRLASEAAVHESKDFIRSEVEKQTNSAIRHVKEKASETVENRIRTLIPGDGTSGENTKTDPDLSDTEKPLPSGPAAGSVPSASAQ